MVNTKFGKWNISEEKLLKDLEKADERGKRKSRQEPRAEIAIYDDKLKMIIVHLTNGSMFGFPVNLIKELESASSDEIAQVNVTELGDALHWDNLDTHYTLCGLLNGIFGSKTWMKEIGRKGGSATSDVKAFAARANGMKGGRPRKTVYQNIYVAVCPSSEYGVKVFGEGTVSPEIKAHNHVSINDLEESLKYINEPLSRNKEHFIKIEPVPFKKKFKEMSKIKNAVSQRLALEE